MKQINIIIISFIITTNLSSQCYPDRHNTTWFDGWESCDMTLNPNNSRGESHWILYDLGHNYTLQNFHLWNVNDPAHLDEGVSKMAIDYSDDGITWKEFQIVDVPVATGKSIYEGEDIANFDGLTTRYILLTILENYGGTCSGFAEMRIEVSPTSNTEIVGFQIDCDDKENITQLNWILDDEIEKVSFNIERSFNGNDWEIVNSTGQVVLTNGNSNFSYNDKCDKDAFYRITAIGANGEKLNSEISFCSKGNILLKAYPNPFNDLSKIEIYSFQNTPIYYSVRDILGRKVIEDSINTASSVNIIDLEGTKFLSGNYFLEVIQGEKRAQLKLVKMR